MKEYGQKHKEKLQGQKKEYYLNHKEEMQEYHKKYHQAHKEEMRKQKKGYYLKHKEEKRKYDRNHKEERKGYMQKYYQSGIEKKNCIKAKAKRKRDLGFIPFNIFGGAFQEFENDFHHCNNAIVISVPSKIHESNLGENHKEKRQ